MLLTPFPSHVGSSPFLHQRPPWSGLDFVWEGPKSMLAPLVVAHVGSNARRDFGSWEGGSWGRALKLTGVPPGGGGGHLFFSVPPSRSNGNPHHIPTFFHTPSRCNTALAFAGFTIETYASSASLSKLTSNTFLVSSFSLSGEDNPR